MSNQPVDASCFYESSTFVLYPAVPALLFLPETLTVRVSWLPVPMIALLFLEACVQANHAMQKTVPGRVVET